MESYGIAFINKDGCQAWEGCESGYYHGLMDDEGNFVGDTVGPFGTHKDAYADLIKAGHLEGETVE